MSALDLVLYFAFVAVALAGLYFLLVKLGRRGHRDLTEEEARAFFATRYPGQVLSDALCLKHSVLFAASAGTVGLVRAKGAFLVARLLTAEEVGDIAPHHRGIALKTSDYADPFVILETDKAEKVRSWLNDALDLGQ